MAAKILWTDATMKAQHLLARWLLLSLTVISLIACTTTPKLVFHSFEFDFIYDSPDAELLDYRYGNSKNPAARNSEWMLSQGKSKQQSGTGGLMLRGDDLYVKWRSRSTGHIYEDTVDLRNRLPADIANCRILFLVRGPQLYVYLVTPQKRSQDEAPNGPRMYHDLKTLTIYPDQQKSQSPTRKE